MYIVNTTNRLGRALFFYSTECYFVTFISYLANNVRCLIYSCKNTLIGNSIHRKQSTCTWQAPDLIQFSHKNHFCPLAHNTYTCSHCGDNIENVRCSCLHSLKTACKPLLLTFPGPCNELMDYSHRLLITREQTKNLHKWVAR